MGPIKGLEKQIITQTFHPGHSGVDLRCVNPKDENMPVVATEDCRVLRSGIDGYGNYFVVVKPMVNTSFTELKYIHLAPSNHMPGQELKEGEKIGVCAIGGNSKSLHLHFETWKQSGAVDPVEYFDLAGIKHKLKET
jgi:murein DD-endopeptidase MepM/ murein hydrolase activator NlpD